jgi:hypothetical protein
LINPTRSRDLAIIVAVIKKLIQREFDTVASPCALA